MKYLFALLLIGANAAADIKATNVGTSGGRFQLIQLSDFRRDQYMIDNQTGKLWKPVCLSTPTPEGDCVLVWRQESVEGITATHEQILKMGK